MTKTEVLNLLKSRNCYNCEDFMPGQSWGHMGRCLCEYLGEDFQGGICFKDSKNMRIINAER